MVVMSAVRVAQTIITLDSFASMVVMMMMLTIITPTSERVSELVCLPPAIASAYYECIKGHGQRKQIERIRESDRQLRQNTPGPRVYAFCILDNGLDRLGSDN
uniref:Uncharacterized protein n=1 Tax=Anopheles coluzzii TaxID=1518534 RepID=A0A8W7PHD7_ANOCL